jgi:hypothetical protein
MVDSLNALYQSAGLDVVFSTNPADFEFQPFSTIYLAGSTDPTRTLFELFGGTNTLRTRELFGENAFGAGLDFAQPFGYSQRSDALNTDLEDDAVVFVPSFSLLGVTQSQADIDLFVRVITGAVGRRAGELMGARLTVGDDSGPSGTAQDVFAANSVQAPAPAFTLSNAERELSAAADTIDDTNFFLGRQRALSLLGLGVARR